MNLTSSRSTLSARRRTAVVATVAVAVVAVVLAALYGLAGAPEETDPALTLE
ncbi:hypothetical protein [Jiangella asiatica]|uniref:hypothetical protein n=1 Tax=Jiangella asiatica TaxID=2530372 RepID=UPI0013A5CECF|nr:hypothetical protein [Jiangella asiatica]